MCAASCRPAHSDRCFALLHLKGLIFYTCLAACVFSAHIISSAAWKWQHLDKWNNPLGSKSYENEVSLLDRLSRSNKAVTMVQTSRRVALRWQWLRFSARGDLCKVWSPLSVSDKELAYWLSSLLVLVSWTPLYVSPREWWSLCCDPLQVMRIKTWLSVLCCFSKCKWKQFYWDVEGGGWHLKMLPCTFFCYLTWNTRVCVCHVFVRWCVIQQRNEVFMALMLHISKQNTITWPPPPRMHGALPPWVHRLFTNGRWGTPPPNPRPPLHAFSTRWNWARVH